jgi:hypothetical protein
MKKQLTEPMARAHVKIVVEMEVELGRMSLDDALVRAKALTTAEVLEAFDAHNVNDDSIIVYGLYQELP